MNNYLLTAVGTLALWLFYYAYKHPKAYNSRFPVLLLLIASTSLCFVCWFYSGSYQLKNVLSLVPKENLHKINQTIEVQDFGMNISGMIGAVSMMYITVLLFIHNILGTDKDD